MLIGREGERESIERLLEHARAGTSGTLVVRGEPGVGKTALLRYAVDIAESMTVVRATGLESESELEFSGLLGVCRPLLSGLDGLPDPQAAALRVALGLSEGAVGDRFAVGAATLSLFALVADSRPLLVVVDDAQWVDRASLEALRFAARRLVDDPVAILFAARDDGFDAEGLAELRLGGIDAAAAARLVRQASGRDVADDVVEALHAATGGNPLALVELPAGLTEAQLSGAEALTTPLPVGEGIARAFAGRLDALPEQTRWALALAAAADLDAIEPIARALQASNVDPSALEPAEDAGLVTVDGERLTFRHPLLRPVAYAAVSASARRDVHRSLAGALGAMGDDDRRAWHLAAAALGPDEEVADALAETARRASGRGGAAAAAAAFERAARLTPDPARRVERFADAAEAAWNGGDSARASELADEALSGDAEPVQAARLLRVRGRIELQEGSDVRARDRFLEAAALTEATAPSETVMALAHAVFAAHFGGRIAESVELARRVRALAPEDGGAADLSADYVLGRSLLLAGTVAEGRARLERVVDLSLGDESPSRVAFVRAAVALAVLERPKRSREVIVRTVELARDEGPMGLASSLTQAAEIGIRADEWQRAVADAVEGLELSRALGQPNIAAHCLAALARIEGLRGHEDACRRHAEEAFVIFDRSGGALPRAQLRCSLALLDMGADRPESALVSLDRVATDVASMELVDVDVAPEPEMIEALVRLGRVEEAGARFDAWIAGGLPRELHAFAAVEARCRGLLADDAGFQAQFVQALEHHVACEDGFAAARTLLCFGERLRRAGLRREARERLRDALATFEQLEAGVWTERARRELRASGERLRRRDESAEELTPQELQVALQVAEGKSNKEVAAALFLSPKTIEFHLSRIYRKLEVSSRSELVRRFAQELVPA